MDLAVTYNANEWINRHNYCNVNVAASEAAIKKSNPLRLFISGDRSQVGKSSVCLGILKCLLNAGYNANEIAYIKPVTQCESTQFVAKFCNQYKIDNVPIGPVVFYSGFTREFLNKNTSSTAEMLEQVKASVDKLCSENRKIIIIDGVGYPAVGSIVGLSNAATAKALKATVLLVGKSGVGDAVDSFNLNRVFFEHHQVPIAGVIFNRFPSDPASYYNLEKCKAAIDLYFQQYCKHVQVFGYIPELTDLIDLSPKPDKVSPDKPKSTKDAPNSNMLLWSENDDAILNVILQAFTKYVVPIEQIITRVEAMQKNEMLSIKEVDNTLMATSSSFSNNKRSKRTREEIENAAKSSGASGG